MLRAFKIVEVTARLHSALDLAGCPAGCSVLREQSRRMLVVQVLCFGRAHVSTWSDQIDAVGAQVCRLLRRGAVLLPTSTV